MQDSWSRLVATVRSQVHDREAWECAELHLLDLRLRERLCALRVQPSPDLAVALMAVAMVLAERTPEWGGDARDALGDLAMLGLALLEDRD